MPADYVAVRDMGCGRVLRSRRPHASRPSRWKTGQEPARKTPGCHFFRKSWGERTCGSNFDPLPNHDSVRTRDPYRSVGPCLARRNVVGPCRQGWGTGPPKVAVSRRRLGTEESPAVDGGAWGGTFNLSQV